MKKILHTLIALLWLSIGNAQSTYDNRYTQIGNTHTCKIILEKKLYLHSSIVLYVNNTQITNSEYSLKNDTLFLEGKPCNDTAKVNYRLHYRYIYLAVPSNLSLLDSTALLLRNKDIDIAYDLTPDTKKGDRIIDSKTLDYNGSFSRGFSVGNAQSLVPNSKFDLQMQGLIGDGIKINAALSDDNIPIQPEGNTQVLNEFDKIYIELSKGTTRVNAGDFMITKPESYFMQYLKKVKGLGVHHTLTDKSSVFNTSGNISYSRGKFARQTLAVKEGNQGPYKLNGINNERYIIVLSGTEKIYFNGELLKRGQEFDYVIDYNLAEITFSPNRLISREARIIAEFEYTDQNYLRTLYTTSARYENKKQVLQFNFYSEQDSKKSTGQIELDSSAISTLAQAGDDDRQYQISTIRQSDISTEIIKYELLKNPNYPQDSNEYLLQFSTDQNKTLYTSVFTEVGSNKGSYIIDPIASVNGRVYKYAGKYKGSYEPINQLVPPEKKQLMDLFYTYNPRSKTQIYTNVALSNYDKNRLSDKSDNDNTGLAFYIKLNHEKKLKKYKEDSLSYYVNAASEITPGTFKPLNQYRPAEFIRDWNYKAVNKNEQYHIATIGIKTSRHIMGLTYKRYVAGSDYQGTAIGLEVGYHTKGLHIKANPTYVSTHQSKFTTSFFRPNIKIEKNLGAFSFGYDLEAEDNRKNTIQNNLLDSTSYAFTYAKYFIAYKISDELASRLSYNKRVDDFTQSGALTKAFDIQEVEWSGTWSTVKQSILGFTVKMRDFSVINDIGPSKEKDKLTLLGNIDHQLKLFKKSLMLNSNYLVNSGQEPKLEYVFQKVENLRGDYVYVGTDSTIVKNINDFRYDPSNPLAQYTRFVIPNNEFTTTNNISLNQNINIDPKKYWIGDTSKATVVRKFISRWTNVSLLRYTNKSTASSARFNYIDFSSNDSTTVSYLRNINSTTMYNRGSTTYDLSFIYRNNGGKTNQINGFEQRNLLEREYKIRITPWKNIDLNAAWIGGKKQFANKVYADRNFIIDYSKISAELSYRIGTKARLVTKYLHSENKQKINAGEASQKNEYSFDINWRRSQSSSCDLGISYINVAYQGNTKSVIQYDILESLQPGANYLWQVNITQRVSKMVDLIVGYEGRKTGINNAIHVGRIQAKATF